MSIIINPSEYVKPTVDQIVVNLKTSNFTFYSSVNKQHSSLFRAIWNNANYTPKEIIDGFGVDGAALFQLSSNLQQILASVDPEYIPLRPTNAFTINEDGTVTIDMDTPYSDS